MARRCRVLGLPRKYLSHLRRTEQLLSVVLNNSSPRPTRRPQDVVYESNSGERASTSSSIDASSRSGHHPIQKRSRRKVSAIMLRGVHRAEFLLPRDDRRQRHFPLRPSLYRLADDAAPGSTSAHLLISERAWGCYETVQRSSLIQLVNAQLRFPDGTPHVIVLASAQTVVFCSASPA